MRCCRAIRKYGTYTGPADKLEARTEGKLARLLETDAIVRLIEYAREQGSKSANMYYMSITKLVHRTQFAMKNGSPGSKQFRDKLDTIQLSFLTTAEYAVARAVEEGLDRELPYKEIYRHVKGKVKSYVNSVGQVPLLPYQEAA